MSNKEQKKPTVNTSLPTAYVIGGAGFIGSYVCEIIRTQNVNVIALDDLSTGKELYIEKLKNDPGFQLIKTNINEGFDQEWPKADYIFHIGGIEAYVNGLDVSLNTMLVNSIGTYHSLEFAKKHKSKYLLVSSLDIYNGALSSVDLNKYFGLSDRDSKRYTHHEAKRYAEALVTEYFQKFDLDARIVRIAETYGPRMQINAGTELAQLFSNALFSDTITINGDGLKILHPTFVSDVTSGISKAMFTKESSGKIFNLASKDETNILNFAYAVQKNSTKPLKIQFTQEYKEIKFPLHKIELTTSQEDLGWTAKTSLDDGITQTLEFFYLQKDKITAEELRISTKDETKNEIPYIPHSTIDQDTQPNAKGEVGKQSKNKKDQIKKTGKHNKANIAILSISFFVILLMFIFPITTLYLTSSSSFAKALDAVNSPSPDQKLTNEKFASTQKNISLANAQFDNLEWFFSMLRQRNRFESSRSALQVVDKFTRAYITANAAKSESKQLQSEILNGTTTQERLDENERRMNESLLTFENTLLESQTIKETIFSQKVLNELNSIVTLTQENLATLRNHTLLQQNLRGFIAPKTSKYYSMIFLDNTYANQQGGKVYAYALVEATEQGIKDIKVYPYTESKTEFADVITKIKDSAEIQKFGTVEAVLLVTDDVRRELVNTLKNVPNELHAEVITPTNYDEKIVKKETSTQYKVDFWTALWSTMKNTNDISSVGTILQKAIINENIQILMINDGTITYPNCNEQNILLQNFTNTPTIQTVNPPYCLRPQIQSSEPTSNLEWSVKTTANTQTLKASTIYTLINKDKVSRAVTVILTVPGSPKITNLLSPFPVSFDKIKTDASSSKTTWEYPVEIAPNGKTEVTFEWNANLSDGNIETNGLYIEKQFGTMVKNISAEIKTESTKPLTGKSENKDLFIPPITP